MTSIFISTYNAAKLFYANREKYKFKWIITDKISVSEFFNANQIRCILLSKYINEKHYKNIFRSKYSEFNNLLLKLDQQTYAKKLNKKFNLNFYNTFRYLGNRDFAGLKILEFTLNRVIKIKKIKKIIFFDGIEGNIFGKNFYAIVLQASLKNKVIFENEKHKTLKKKEHLHNLFNNISKLFFIKNYSIQFFYFIKKKITELYPFKSREGNILIFEPLFDLYYFPYKINNTLFCKSFNFDNSENFLNKNKIKKEFKKFRNHKYLVNYLFNLMEQNKDYSIKKILYIKQIVKKNKVKRILLGCDPNPILGNIIKHAAKFNVKIIGCQHGGGYLVQNYDEEHIDSDYNFCDYFLSYGSSNKINKRIKKKILNIGSFKSNFYDQTINPQKKKLEKNNILFIPTEVSPMSTPTIEIIQDKRFTLQKEICRYLNLSKKEIYIKVLKNYDLFPIINHIKKNHKDFKIEYSTINQSIKTLRPKIIILDYLGTTLYQALYSDAKIILFLDKYNMPKQDVLKILKKRVFVVKNINELKSLWPTIDNTNLKTDNMFLDNFFKFKSNYLMEQKYKKIIYGN